MTLISILSRQEIEEFNNTPNFNSDERKRFFDLTVILQQTIKTLRTPENKILFFVSYAYFKAKKRLYPGKLCEKDLEYACNILKIDYSVIKDKLITRKKYYHLLAFCLLTFIIIQISSIMYIYK